MNTIRTVIRLIKCECECAFPCIPTDLIDWRGRINPWAGCKVFAIVLKDNLREWNMDQTQDFLKAAQHFWFTWHPAYLNMPFSGSQISPWLFSGFYWITVCMEFVMHVPWLYWLRWIILRILKIEHAVWLVKNQDKSPLVVNSYKESE